MLQKHIFTSTLAIKSLKLRKDYLRKCKKNIFKLLEKVKCKKKIFRE